MTLKVTHATPTKFLITSLAVHVGTPVIFLDPSTTISVWALSNARNERKTSKFYLFSILITRVSFFIPWFLTVDTGLSIAILAFYNVFD